MTITELGSIGELIGAILVLVTLIYLAIQLRANNDIAKVSGHRDLIKQFNDWYREMEDQALVEILIKGSSEFSQLSSQEQLKFDSFLHRYLHICEQAAYMGRGKFIPQGSYDAFMFAAVAMTSHGAREWWNESKLTYAADFVTMIEKVREQHPDISPIWELFPSIKFVHRALQD